METARHFGYNSPLELNAQELAELGIGEAELIVYGYLPVMISAQCLKKAQGKCTGNTGITVLTDRYGNKFPVKNVCAECFNVIYNTRPLYLGMHKNEIRQLGPSVLRLQFSVEDQDTAKGIIEQFAEAFSGPGGRLVPEFAYTQGHFKRGVL